MPSKLVNRTGEASEPGTLYVVATPIGNLGDITLRALDTLRSVQLIAAEDTRHTRKLLSHFDIHRPLISYHSRNIHQRGPELLDRIRAGEDIALVTDAGSPTISDPGALLVQQAVESDLPVTVIPGPTASIAALSVSGLPTHPFAFLGFPPSRGSGRSRFFASYSMLSMTLILYESPQRLQRTIEDMLHHWGDRRIAVARELTKHFEEVFRGSIAEAKEYFSQGVKGELTLVVEGSSGGEKAGDAGADWRKELENLLGETDMTVKEATIEIVKRHHLPRRAVYQEALRLKRD